LTLTEPYVAKKKTKKKNKKTPWLSSYLLILIGGKNSLPGLFCGDCKLLLFPSKAMLRALSRNLVFATRSSLPKLWSSRVPLVRRLATPASSDDGNDSRQPRSFLDDGESVPDSASLQRLRDWYDSRDQVLDARIASELEEHTNQVLEAAAKAAEEAVKAQKVDLTTQDPLEVLSEAYQAETAAEEAAAGIADVDADELTDADAVVVPPEEGEIPAENILTLGEIKEGTAKYHDLMPGRILQPGDRYMPEDLNPFQPPQPKTYTFTRQKLVCPLCQPGSPEISFKVRVRGGVVMFVFLNVAPCQNLLLLSRFISETGRIMPRRRTGVCAKQQRQLANAIKLARHVGYLPYTHKHPKYQDAVLKPKSVTQY
jgi:ribosomal protein S18